jgi:pimeloyl-ACP methyl ester carboxylesterase
MGVSIGGTLALLARQRVPEAVERVVAISPDLDTAAGERHAYEQIMAAVREPRWKWLAPKAARLQPPPCLDPTQFRLRATLLGHLGALEAGTSYGSQVRRLVLGIAGTYGPHRLPRVLANMDASTRALAPELARSTSSPLASVTCARGPDVRRRRSSLPSRDDRESPSAAGPAGHASRRSRRCPHGTLRRPGGRPIPRPREKPSGSPMPAQNAATHLGMA